MNSRDDTTTFLPLNSRISGQNRDSCPTVGQYLTTEQTNYIYKKVETGEMINTDMIQQEIEQEKQVGRIDNISRETNPYKELTVSNAEKINIEEYRRILNVIVKPASGRGESSNASIWDELKFEIFNDTNGTVINFSSILNYVQHSIFNSMNHMLDVRAMNKYKSKPNVDREFKELDFGMVPQKLQEEYMDIYEGIHSK